MPKPTQPAPATNKRTTSTNLSTSKPGFMPVKSAKPLTKSNFTLPGDVISAKLKAQREEQRIKKEEAEAEAARKRTVFKARPIPKTSAAGQGRISSVLPKETATSRARMSLIAARKDEDGKKNDAPVVKKNAAGSRVGLLRSGSIVRKSVVPSNESALSVTKTRTGPPTASRATTTTIPANSSAVRRNKTNHPAFLTNRPSSIQLTTRSGSGPPASSNPKPVRMTVTMTARAPTTTTTTTRTSKGKEIFSRVKLAEEDLLKQKREKEAAAKKARAEAAERGRLASREWAERQKKKGKTMMTTTARMMVVEKAEVEEGLNNVPEVKKVGGGKDCL